MSRRLRVLLFFVTAPVFAGLVVWGLSGLPDFGHYDHLYGNLISRAAPVERHTTNAVGATVFDYRGFDTLGEEFILFLAAMGVALLLREHGAEEARKQRDAVESDPVGLLGLLMVPATVALALWLVAFGYVTPGGGFQGGVVLAGGLVLVWVAGAYRAFLRTTPKALLDLAEGTGAGAYVAVGLAAVISGLPFLHNLLGLGVTGTIWSGGSIGLLNWAAAVEVAAANVLLYQEFLEEYVLVAGRRQ